MLGGGSGRFDLGLGLGLRARVLVGFRTALTRGRKVGPNLRMDVMADTLAAQVAAGQSSWLLTLLA